MKQLQATLVLTLCVGLSSALACNAVLGIDEATLACPSGSTCPASASTEPLDGEQAAGTEQAVQGVLPDAGGRAPIASVGVPSDVSRGDAGSEGSSAPPSSIPEPAVPNLPLPEMPAPNVPLPPLCSAGEVDCDGARLLLCNAQGTGFLLLEDCSSPARCDAAAAACSPAACEPDERRCQGSALQVCNADGTGFVLEQQCASAALCSPAGCAPALCGANQRRCQGAQLELCNADQTGFGPEQQCASAALCSPAGCQPAACGANERRCQGAQLEVCNADRNGFAVEQQCASAELCSPAGCQPPPAPPPPPPALCFPGARRCLNANTVAVCDASGFAEASSPCPLLQSCSAGNCSLIGIFL